MIGHKIFVKKVLFLIKRGILFIEKCLDSVKSYKMTSILIDFWMAFSYTDTTTKIKKGNQKWTPAIVTQTGEQVKTNFSMIQKAYSTLFSGCRLCLFVHHYKNFYKERSDSIQYGKSQSKALAHKNNARGIGGISNHSRGIE